MSSVLPRAIFFGTPDFAVPCLRVLAQLADVKLVITQPDRPSGRGMKLTAPPVKVLAEELGLRVLQPTKVRTPEFAETLEALQVDVAVVVAYGRILPLRVLQAPRAGCVNVHASLLPKYRGAAPIQWAIVRGEHETGVCLMQMDEGMDTGAVLARASLAIGVEETAGELAPRLSLLGAELLQRELPRHLAGELRAVPQEHAQATLAPILRKEDGQIDWSRSATEIDQLVRGMNPWPGAFSWLDGVRIKVHRAQVVRDAATGRPHGAVVCSDTDGLLIACGNAALRITELQLEGGRRMPAASFAANHKTIDGARFSNAPAALTSDESKP